MNKRSVAKKVRPYVMIAPAMLGILVFTIYPIIKLIELSLKDTNMLNPSNTKFVGLDNYTKVLSRPDFQKSMVNTVVYTIAVVFLITAIALILAVWLNAKNTRLNRLVQAAVFCPHVVSIVSIALIWLWMMEPNFGLFNYILKSLGLPTLKWLSGSQTAMPSVILVSVWKAVGYDTLLLLAALQSVPTSLYEAAKLDHANKLVMFF